MDKKEKDEPFGYDRFTVIYHTRDAIHHNLRSIMPRRGIVVCGIIKSLSQLDVNNMLTNNLIIGTLCKE